MSSLGRLFSAPWVYGYWKASPPPSFPEGVNISPSPSVLSLGLFFCHSVFSLHQRLNAGGLRRDHSQLTLTHTHMHSHARHAPVHHVIPPSLYLSILGVWRTKLRLNSPGAVYHSTETSLAGDSHPEQTSKAVDSWSSRFPRTGTSTCRCCIQVLVRRLLADSTHEH